MILGWNRACLLVVTGALVGEMTACSSSTGSPFLLPGPTPVEYAGSIQDSLYGDGSLRVSLSTAQGVTSGLWRAAFAQRIEPQLVTDGAISNNVYTGIVHPYEDGTTSSTGCQFSMMGTFSGARFSGSYATRVLTPACSTARTGTFDLAR